MRVLIVAPLAESLVRFRGDLIRELKLNNFDVHTCAPMPDSSALREIEALSVFHPMFLKRHSLNPLTELRSFISIYKVIRCSEPDTVLAYTIKPVIYTAFASHLLNSPKRRVALITGLGHAFIQKGLGGCLKKTLAKVLYRIALCVYEEVIFQNSDDAELFVQSRLVDARKVTIVNGSGVNLSSFPHTPLPTEVVRFIFIGRLLKEKGISEFIDAACFVKREFPDAEFWIIGSVDDNPTSISLTEIESLQDRGILSYFGFQSEILQYLQSSSVFVLPSYREGTSRAALEALAVGRPIITTDAPGCRQTVTHDVNGKLVTPRSVEHLVDAINFFLKRPEKIAEYGNASRELAVKRFDVKFINKKMIETINGRQHE